jgi:dihydroorotase (multifunctional complex type)
MNSTDLVIRNVRVVRGSGVSEPCDIIVREGKISGINASGLHPFNGEKIYDGGGLYALPGLVDLHFHSGLGSESRLYTEFNTESRAAVSGGFTYVRCHLILGPDAQNGYLGKIDRIISRLEQESYADFGLNPQIGSMTHVAEMNQLIQKGINAFKIFYDAYKGEEGRRIGILVSDDIKKAVISAMEEAAKHKHVRLMFHAEDADIVEHFTKRIATKGDKSLEALSQARPETAEEIKVREISQLAKLFDAKIHFVHLSSKAAVEAAKEYMGKVDLTIETEPHYLIFDYTNKTIERYGSVNPPIRSPADKEYLINAIKTGVINSVSTDTNPASLKDKQNGMPGFDNIQIALPLMITFLVKTGILDITHIARVMSESPARLVHAAAKGEIDVGKDADLVLIDLKDKSKLQDNDLVNVGGTEWFPYFEYELYGIPKAVFLRGSLIYERGNGVTHQNGKFTPIKQEQ